jgi:hypothetical protein
MLHQGLTPALRFPIWAEFSADHNTKASVAMKGLNNNQKGHELHSGREKSSMLTKMGPGRDEYRKHEFRVGQQREAAKDLESII